MCTPKDDIINVETCLGKDDIKQILRTCVVIECIMLKNDMDYNGAELNTKPIYEYLHVFPLTFPVNLKWDVKRTEFHPSNPALAVNMAQ